MLLLLLALELGRILVLERDRLGAQIVVHVSTPGKKFGFCDILVLS